MSLKGKKNQTAATSLLVVQQEVLDNKNTFSELVPSILYPLSWKFLASEGLPLKVIFILGNAPGHPKPHEFNTEGMEVVYLPPNTLSLT